MTRELSKTEKALRLIGCYTLETELAALEAEVVRLREALEVKHDSVESLMSWCVKNVDKWGFKEYDYLRYAVKKMKEALSSPLTTTALNELIEKVEKMTIERCAVITAMSIIDMPTTVEISTVRKYSKAIRALPVGHIKLEDLL